MKKTALFLFILLIIGGAAAVSLNTSVSRPLARLPAAQGNDFRRLTYRLYLFGLIPVGEASLDNAGIDDFNGRPVIHIVGSGVTAPYLSGLIKGSFSADSYIDSETLYPCLFTQTLKVTGKPDNTRQIAYDQKAGMMTVDGTERDVGPGVRDPLSAFYYLTRMDLDEASGTIGMDVNSNQKTYSLGGTVSKALLKVGNAPFDVVTVKADVRRKDKNPYHTSRLTCVLSKRHANAPVLIKVFAGGVLVTAQLTDFQ